MNRKIITAVVGVLVVVGVVLLIVFSGSNEQKIELPKEAPDTTVVTYSYNTGFTGDFFQYVITPTSIETTYYAVQGQAPEDATYQIRPSAFEYLYDNFLYYQYTDIEIVEDFVADKGGASITLDLGDGTVVEKDATGGNYPSEEDRAEFYDLASAIEEFVEAYQE
jgi:hypothetical protein